MVIKKTLSVLIKISKYTILIKHTEFIFSPASYICPIFEKWKPLLNFIQPSPVSLKAEKTQQTFKSQVATRQFGFWQCFVGFKFNTRRWIRRSMVIKVILLNLHHVQQINLKVTLKNILVVVQKNILNIVKLKT